MRCAAPTRLRPVPGRRGRRALRARDACCSCWTGPRASSSPARACRAARTGRRCLQAVTPWLSRSAPDAPASLRHGPDGAAAIDQRSCLVAPLIAGEELLGYLYADVDGASGRFDDADRDLLRVACAAGRRRPWPTSAPRDPSARSRGRRAHARCAALGAARRRAELSDPRHPAGAAAARLPGDRRPRRRQAARAVRHWRHPHRLVGSQATVRRALRATSTACAVPCRARSS